MKETLEHFIESSSPEQLRAELEKGNRPFLQTLDGQTPKSLTKTETKVLTGIASGKALKEIGNTKTVQYHWTNIRRKLGINSIAQAVQWALATGMVQNQYMKG